MTETTADEVLFSEPGATWLWALVGPGSAVAMALIQLSTGYGLQLLVPGVFLVLVTGFLSIQIKAARIHTSVELTPEYLRQGRETIRVSEIVKVFPEASGAETPKWQSARALGELTGVPRGRTGIGVKLSNDRTAQAWARKHKQLRAALTAAVGRARVVTSRMIATVQLVLAGAAAVGCVLSWVAARSSEVVAPIIPGEPSKSSLVYDPSMIALALLLAAVAGLLVVAGVARLCRR